MTRGVWLPFLLVACSGEDRKDRKDRETGTPDTTETGPTDPAEVTLRVGLIPELGTGAWLQVQVEPPADVEVTCEADDDRWVAERPAAPEVEVRWTGLLPGARYSCTARAGGGRASAALELPPLPPDLTEPLVTGSTTGYTLYNTVNGGRAPRAVVIDPSGRIRWYHDLAGDPNIGLEASFVEQTTEGPMFLFGGGEGYHPSLLDLEGQVRWTAPASQSGGAYHHDTAWVDTDGEQVLGLSRAGNDYGTARFEGFDLELFRAFTGERTWVWSSQTAVDRGQLPPAGDEPDAYHANAVLWHPEDPEGPAWFLSLKRLHQLVRLDPASGDVTWRLGVGGDFRLLEAGGRPAADERWFYGEHGPKAVLKDPAGIWDVWLHDNGYERPDTPTPFSRVLHLEVDVPARTARIVWEWSEPGWYEPVFGDVDLVDGGRVLVTMGHCPQCAGADPRRVTSYVEIDPATDAVTWRADLRTTAEAGYRADRIDACALFPENRTWCTR